MALLKMKIRKQELQCKAFLLSSLLFPFQPCHLQPQPTQSLYRNSEKFGGSAYFDKPAHLRI